jgi:crotonobetainyl-CoA:carnitine CoA-transferase CaiB-like acyl-CoA transferase
VKLEGIRVVDLSLFLPGPWLTQAMADHGAEVIKVEPPGGDPFRQVGLESGGAPVPFRANNRGKKSIVLDLKRPDCVAALLRLAETADVFVETFRPGVVDRLGVGYAAVAARNPRIVYASLSAFGQTGPERLRPAHDLAVEALAGSLSLNLGADGEPTNPGMLAADITGSFAALTGILMALVRRATTGRGDHVDVSMHDATLSWLGTIAGPVFAEDRAPEVKAQRNHGGSALAAIYRTQDGRHVVLGGVEEKFARNLLTALGRPDLIAPAIGPPGAGQEPVKAFLRETFRTRSRDGWEAWFAGRDICFAPLLDLREALHHPQAAARQMLVRDRDGNLHIGLPVKFADEPGRLDPRLPDLGEHGRAILAGLGYGAAEIDRLLSRAAP